jgi:hypothetical protein
MAEEKKIAEATAEEVQETTEETTERKGVIVLNKPYLFEGTEYAEIDMNGLEALTVKDAVDAQRELFNEREVAASTLCETTTAFARKMACKATGLPIEFFQLAPRRVSRQVTAAVHAYLNRSNQTENHVMQLDKPYQFKGKTYTEIDLNSIADLNSLNESEAENRIVRAGFMVTENTFNYLYACTLASMATGLPDEFFTGLPLYEALKIKNAVNDAGFFE